MPAEEGHKQLHQTQTQTPWPSALVNALEAVPVVQGLLRLSRRRGSAEVLLLQGPLALELARCLFALVVGTPG